jgi:uncharacterized protein (TIGR03435 family)
VRIRFIGLIAVAACLQAAEPAFEVASLKLSGPIEPLRARLFEMMGSHGPFRSLPGNGRRVEIKGMSASELIAAAYRISTREIVGPSWMFDTRFEIEALIPVGRSRDQAQEMLLTLLQERLGLKAHREVRKMSGYVLSVGKGGPKLTEAPPLKPTSDVGSLTERPRTPFNGLRIQLGHADMTQLANDLAWDLKAPVEDHTGVKGFYVIELKIPASERDDEFDRAAGFREALKAYGLQLTGGRIDVSVLVVDELSRTPTAN